ncbi:O-linked GlcNAc transferase [Lysinibacillus sp. LZ02]|uniref:O-linked GlcNAc transferase n=1 Tax=Lysinibacillus sp. LZ02 TaxID=3420668 RepID=UPI003D36C4CC
MHEMEQYFYNGQVHLSLQAAQEVKEDAPEAQTAKQLIALYERYGVAAIPCYSEKAKQSVERADETYAEMDDVAEIRAIQDEEAFGKRIKQLEQVAKTGTSTEKAQSFFTQGQLFLYAHHYDESVHCFMQAVKHHPNKAVYYGIAAQTMNRFSYPPFEVLGYLERAIDLDPQNARWYWNKALVLTQLYKDLKKDLFLENALITLEKAQANCREEQKSLKTAIENTFENMREYLFQ